MTVETVITGTGARAAELVTSRTVWAGRALGGLAILFLVIDGVMKVVPFEVVIISSAQIGWPADPGLWRLLGSILLGSTLLYAIPRTSMLGAILLTGYLGGAVASHVRIGSPLFSHVLFGVYLGMLLWGGLWLRDPRVRALLPIAR
jgi:DoxX-like family